MSSEGHQTLPPVPPVPPFSPVPPPTPGQKEAAGVGSNNSNGSSDNSNNSAGGGKSHHISDIGTWKNPDRNYFVFVILSVLLGLLGADHFYLRSFQTGMLKIIFNIFTLGFWHYWDLIQIVSDGKKVREEGLTSPFDWICGIGKGVFTSAESEAKKPHYVAQKSYLLYAFLAIFFGFLGFDKLYMGEFWQGVAKCLSCFNIFLFLFGFIWVVWDSVHALFMTKSILEDGIVAPIPYSFIFSKPIDGKQFLVNHVFDPKVDGGGIGGIGSFNFNLNNLNPFVWIEKIIPALPVPTVSYKGLYSDLVVPFMTPTVVAAINASKSTEPIVKLPELPDAPTMPGLAKFGLPTALPALPTALPTLPTALPGLPTPSVGVGLPISQAAPAAPAAPGPAAPGPAAPGPAAPGPAAPGPAAPGPAAPGPGPAPAAPAPAAPAQAGGGSRNHGGPGPAIAGVLTAVVLAGGLKGFYDVISKQYG